MILFYILLIPWLVFFLMTLLSFKPVQQPLLYILLLAYPLSLVFVKKTKSKSQLLKYLPVLVFIVLFVIFGKLLTNT